MRLWSFSLEVPYLFKYNCMHLNTSKQTAWGLFLSKLFSTKGARKTLQGPPVLPVKSNAAAQVTKNPEAGKNTAKCDNVIKQTDKWCKVLNYFLFCPFFFFFLFFFLYIADAPPQSLPWIEENRDKSFFPLLLQTKNILGVLKGYHGSSRSPAPYRKEKENI